LLATGVAKRQEVLRPEASVVAGATLSVLPGLDAWPWFDLNVLWLRHPGCKQLATLALRHAPIDRACVKTRKGRKIAPAAMISLLENSRGGSSFFLRRVYGTKLISYSLVNPAFADPVASQHLSIWMVLLAVQSPIHGIGWGMVVVDQRRGMNEGVMP
jgi:hypothetical protein